MLHALKQRFVHNPEIFFLSVPVGHRASATAQCPCRVDYYTKQHAVVERSAIITGCLIVYRAHELVSVILSRLHMIMGVPTIDTLQILAAQIFKYLQQ